MRSDDWLPMETAPLNPYGKAYGPTIMIWCRADDLPWPCYFDPTGSMVDNGPRWRIADDARDEDYIQPEDALAWQPIAKPWAVLTATKKDAAG